MNYLNYFKQIILRFFMRIIIARHAATEGNASGTFEGHSEGKLSNLGVMQAERLALRFKEEKLDYIFCSDLLRAVETVTPIIEYHQNAKVEFRKELREYKYGDWEGNTKKELGFRDGYSRSYPKNAETKAQLYRRIQTFFEAEVSALEGNKIF